MRVGHHTPVVPLLSFKLAPVGTAVKPWAGRRTEIEIRCAVCQRRHEAETPTLLGVVVNLDMAGRGPRWTVYLHERSWPLADGTEVILRQLYRQKRRAAKDAGDAAAEREFRTKQNELDEMIVLDLTALKDPDLKARVLEAAGPDRSRFVLAPAGRGVELKCRRCGAKPRAKLQKLEDRAAVAREQGLPEYLI